MQNASEIARVIESEREIEAAVLTALIEANPDDQTESYVRRTLTLEENSAERLAAVGRAVEQLIRTGLVVRVADSLRPTLPALRVAELDLGL